ncbi:MAG TPA: phosphotransferase [Mycobacteriales bacterium]|nr:phosphotransferase [Mycobacteriales bacterium]
MSLLDFRNVLRPWRIVPSSVAPLLGGEKNHNWLVTAAGRRFVVRRYAASSEPEVEYELHASEFLAERGFPTPAPVRTGDGSLWRVEGDRPVAVFDFVEGEHPPEMADGYWSADFSTGRDAAALAGRMHSLSLGSDFAGSRADRLDPVQSIGRFLNGPYSSLPVLREAVAELTDQYEKMVAECADPVDLSRGLVHNDITAHNLLLTPAGGIAALIDFDDCLTSFLLHELGAIVEVWGRACNRDADLGRIHALIDAYATERSLTGRESELALDFIATRAAATGVHVLSNMLRQGGAVQDPRESYSMLLFLDLRARSA